MSDIKEFNKKYLLEEIAELEARLRWNWASNELLDSLRNELLHGSSAYSKADKNANYVQILDLIIKFKNSR